MFFLYRENGDFVILMKYIYIGLPFELKGSCKPCFACPLLDFLGRGRWWDDMIYWGKSSSPLLQALNLMDWNLSEFFLTVKFCYLVKTNWRKTWNENYVKCVFPLELYKQLQNPITFIQHKVTFQGVLSIIGKRKLEYYGTVLVMHIPLRNTVNPMGTIHHFVRW